MGTTSYTYDPSSKRKTMTLPANRTVTYGHNTAGDISTINDGTSGSSSVAYDANGRIAALTRPNGVTTTNTYDTAGRVTGIRHATASTTIDNIRYTLDANGNRTAKSSNRGNEAYFVDNLNRITRATYANGNVTSYDYNAAGDRTAATINGARTAYTYDANGRLTATGATTFAYDGAGNVTRAGTTNYAWDWASRLTQTTTGASTTNYTYDGDDLRVTAASGATTNRYTWDRSSDVPALLSDGISAFIPGPEDEAFETIASNGTKTWTLNDALGSVEYISNATAQTTGSKSYDVFGSARTTTGTQSIFGFTGALTDATATPYLRARELDTTRGRFLSGDTVQPNAFGTQGWNRYSYVANGPTTFNDPTGHMAMAEYGGLTSRQSAVIAAGALAATASVTCSANPSCSAAMEGASEGLANGITGGFASVADALSNVHLAEDAKPGEPVAPPKTLPAFPDATRQTAKTPYQGGGGKRTRWKDSEGKIYEWDRQHGRVEVYDKRGKHQGEYDPNTGAQTKPADKSRRVEP
jgi:RHS repeat-associated protein